MNILCEGIFLVVLCIASVSDWKKRRIPGWITVLLLLPGVLACTGDCSCETGVREALTGLLTGAAFLLIPAIIIRGAVGGGDIKLMGASGFFLGPEWGMTGLFLGLLIAVIYGIAGLVSGKRKRKEAIPLGPFLAFGLSAASLARLFGGSHFF